MSHRSMVRVPWGRVQDILNPIFWFKNQVKVCLRKSFSVSAWKTKCSCSVFSLGQSTLVSITNDSVCSVEKLCVSTRATHSNRCSNQESLRMVEQQRTFHPGWRWNQILQLTVYAQTRVSPVGMHISNRMDFRFMEFGLRTNQLYTLIF